MNLPPNRNPILYATDISRRRALIRGAVVRRIHPVRSRCACVPLQLVVGAGLVWGARSLALMRG